MLPNIPDKVLHCFAQTFAFNGANAGFQRMFDVKVTQVECDTRAA